MDLQLAQQHLLKRGVRDVQVITDPEVVVTRLIDLYEHATATLRRAAQQISRGKKPELVDKHAYYPLVAFAVHDKVVYASPGEAYGFAQRGPGLYTATITRPKHFRAYLLDNIERMMRFHRIPALVGLSTVEIPFDYAVEGDFSAEVKAHFAPKDCQQIASSHQLPDGEMPLAQFTALQTDNAFDRLRHYLGMRGEEVQNFVLLTNYEMYEERFAKLARRLVRDKSSGYSRFVQSEGLRGRNSSKRPQMPAYSLQRPDGNGITLINIRVSSSNALNLMHLLAPLRSHAVEMLGHCGGLRLLQKRGNFVIASAFARYDGTLIKEVPLETPIPPIGEINIALKLAVEEVCGVTETERRDLSESATAASIIDRQWETSEYWIDRLESSNAAAIDMESATIAAAGYYYCVPYGSFLCISDKPLHNQPKGYSDSRDFYATQVDRHFRAGFRALEIIREGMEKGVTPHSKKLRGYRTPAFR